MKTIKITMTLEKITDNIRLNLYGLVNVADSSDKQQSASVYPVKDSLYPGIRIVGYPMLSIYLGNYNNTWDRNRSVTLSRRDLILFMMHMDKFREMYENNYKDLYIFSQEIKGISDVNYNSDIYERCKRVFVLDRSNTQICFSPSYIEKGYNRCKIPGIMITVNNAISEIILYQDFLILYKYLSTLQLDSLYLQLLNIYKLYKGDLLDPMFVEEISDEEIDPNIINDLDMRKEEYHKPVQIKDDPNELDGLAIKN